MSEWITDRLPTEEDAFMYSVFVMAEPLSYRPDGYVIMRNYQRVLPGDAWQPIQVPAPYVKPKRWTVEWNTEWSTWSINDSHRKARFDFVLRGLKIDQGDVAQRIEDLFNEVMP